MSVGTETRRYGMTSEGEIIHISQSASQFLLPSGSGFVPATAVYAEHDQHSALFVVARKNIDYSTKQESGSPGR